MGDRFDYFVIFAEMRTGSNFLEENLNEYPGLKSHGEVFNPVFIGKANQSEYLGVTLAQRASDPFQLLDRMRVETDGLPGFRFFHDHDPRVLEKILSDPRCAKIILTRNPVDSYVSRKIAAATGQWRLSDMKNVKSARIEFDGEEFGQHLQTLQAFQLSLLNTLQRSGQTAFYIGYDDLSDLSVLDGLAAYLGVTHKKQQASKRTKVQNPAPLEQKVANFDAMQSVLAGIDRFDLSRTPNFEPRRAANVPSYVAASVASILFQPIKAGPQQRIHQWLADIDGVAPDDLQSGFTQKTLRQWKRRNPGHRSFAVIRHPVMRLHEAFVAYILGTGPDTYWELRQAMRKNYELPLPEDAPDASFTMGQHKAAFLAFARIIRGNLSGQTGFRVDGSWASQTEILQGMAQVLVPDMVLREDALEQGLEQLAAQVQVAPPELTTPDSAASDLLAEIYDETVEEAVRAAYQKDYMMFGFRALGSL